MNALYKSDKYLLIEHERGEILYQKNGESVNYRLSEKLFMNFKRKCKNKVNLNSEENEMENKIKEFLTECKKRNLFPQYSEDDIVHFKSENINLMNEFYDVSNEFKEFYGENNLEVGIVTTFDDGVSYLIPKKCSFYNKKVEDMSKFLPSSNKFDFIVIDPPWTNRYIKRLKKTDRKQSYNMMTDEDIMNIPIENYTNTQSIVLIWCTNSQTHQAAIEEKFLHKWNLKIITKWKWIKLDKNGEMFCSFDGSKKYEIIYICSHVNNSDPCDFIERDLVVFSNPSSIHSHKPPLIGKKIMRLLQIILINGSFKLRSFSSRFIITTSQMS